MTFPFRDTHFLYGFTYLFTLYTKETILFQNTRFFQNRICYKKLKTEISYYAS